MKSNNNKNLLESIIRDSGIVAVNSPSIHHPIPVALFYRHNPDGSVRWLLPKGDSQADLSTSHNAVSLKAKLIPKLFKVFFVLGLGAFVAHGKLVLYTDLPSATYIQNQWKGA